MPRSKNVLAVHEHIRQAQEKAQRAQSKYSQATAKTIPDVGARVGILLEAVEDQKLGHHGIAGRIGVPAPGGGVRRSAGNGETHGPGDATARALDTTGGAAHIRPCPRRASIATPTTILNKREVSHDLWRMSILSRLRQA